MDAQTVDYLIAYFSRLLPEPEKLALKHVLHSEKVMHIADAASRMRRQTAYLSRGWLSDDDEVLALLQDGVPAFRWRLAHRIYAEHGGDALLNKCPVCNRLARTPTAKQCRYCGAAWRDCQELEVR